MGKKAVGGFDEKNLDDLFSNNKQKAPGKDSDEPAFSDNYEDEFNF